MSGPLSHDRSTGPEGNDAVHPNASDRVEVSRSTRRLRGERERGGRVVVVGEAFVSADLALWEACSGVEGRRGLVPEAALEPTAEAAGDFVGADAVAVVPRGPHAGEEALVPALRAGRGMTPTTVSVNRVVTGAFGRAELDKVATGRPRTRRNY
jgi:hypothetical protein